MKNDDRVGDHPPVGELKPVKAEVETGTEDLPGRALFAHLGGMQCVHDRETLKGGKDRDQNPHEQKHEPGQGITQDRLKIVGSDIGSPVEDQKQPLDPGEQREKDHQRQETVDQFKTDQAFDVAL